MQKQFSQYTVKLKTAHQYFLCKALYILPRYREHIIVSYLNVLTKIEFFWSTIQAGRAIPKLVAKIGRIFLKSLHFQFYFFISPNSVSPSPSKKALRLSYYVFPLHKSWWTWFIFETLNFSRRKKNSKYVNSFFPEHLNSFICPEFM